MALSRTSLFNFFDIYIWYVELPSYSYNSQYTSDEDESITFLVTCYTLYLSDTKIIDECVKFLATCHKLCLDGNKITYKSAKMVEISRMHSVQIKNGLYITNM